MEPELFRMFGNWGVAGIMSAVLWRLSQRFMDAHAASQNARIANLEEGHKQCEARSERLETMLIEELRAKARARHERRHKNENDTEGGE